MIRQIQLLRNIGQFDSVTGPANVGLSPITLIYAENGRGKTTLAAILRSLATSDGVAIAERHRFSATHDPHVVIDCEGGTTPAIFQNNSWSRPVPEIIVFDDHFVDQNVCSGLEVDPEHRQNLHELVLGAQGVALNRKVQSLVDRIEEHNKILRTKTDAIPVSVRGGLSVDDFCSLPEQSDVDLVIEATERQLAAARDQETIAKTQPFAPLSLPELDLERVERLLARDLPTLDRAAADRVQSHVASIGRGGESWVSDGIRRVPPDATQSADCPFCGQDLAGSILIEHYRAYFSTSYSDLKQAIDSELADVNRLHSGESPAAFERAVRVCIERRQFWAKFCEIPEIAVDTANIARVWIAARDAVIKLLKLKQAAPLERLSLDQQTQATVAAFEKVRREVAQIDEQMREANKQIELVREQAAAGNLAVITADLARLKAVKARHTPETSQLCKDYQDEKSAKSKTEGERDQAKDELKTYRETVFPVYETAVNSYLQKFNAGFRLGSVTASVTRTGPTCSYCVVVNNRQVPIAGGASNLGDPSFRTVLSSGDRNTLALAFFFASLDQDPNIANRIVIIDDPMTSLDEHRALTTVQEIRRLGDRVKQVIILSHSKPFLCRVWEGSDSSLRTALHLVRDGSGSNLQVWDVTQDCITEHDRRHQRLRDYVIAGTPNDREVARSVRPLLEAFLRVAYPAHFPPNKLLGHFRNLCEQRVGTTDEILDKDDVEELRDLLEFANKFHHDTNPAWETEAINDTELLHFVNKALAFARR